MAMTNAECERKWRLENPERYAEQRRRWRTKDREEKNAQIRAIKLERGCVDCGYREHPAALHFDHRDASTKVFSLARSYNKPWSKIEAEIAKCDVRCANCHAVRTHPHLALDGR